MTRRLLDRLSVPGFLGFLVVFGALAAAAPAAAAERLEDQIVQLHVSKREVDRNAPWTLEEATQESFLGVVLPGNLILTTAHAVADAANVELARFGSTKRAEAEVAFVDYEINLALLKADAAALKGTRPVAVGDDIGIDDSVEIYRRRDAYQLTRMQATLTEVSTHYAQTSAYGLATYLLKVQQGGLGWSEPVFRQGKLVALTVGQDNNFVHAIPGSLLKHFLADKPDAGYRGFPALGLAMTPLTSPDERKLLHADGVDYGMRVGEVFASSPFYGQLQPDDVLLAIDGHEVSDQGFYTHPRWGKIGMQFLLNQHYAGDLIKLRTLRAGQARPLEARLVRYDSNRGLVPMYRHGQAEPHLIFGGFLFEELSQPYLQRWGRQWREHAPLDLLYVLDFAADPTADPTQRVIFCPRVLADPFNRGYGDIRNEIVDTVNGVRILTLDGLREALRHPLLKNGEAYAVIRFQRDGGEAVLAYDGIRKAHARIAKTYEVATPESFFTPER